MNDTVNQKLGVVSLATLLVSAHYGLGFLLGTAEQAMTLGAGGSLYAVSIGLGTLALIALAKLYWTKAEQIWTLLGDRYGKSVKVGVGLMSWVSLIGIEAVQVIAAASILNVVGIPTLPSMIALSGLFCLLSLLPVEKASWVFRGLLLFNIVALVYALEMLHHLPDYWQTTLDFITTLNHISSTQAIGVSLSTILLVLIDMKCQQFVVQAKNVRTVYLGCGLAALLLIGLAFLPSAVVIAAQHANLLPPELSGKAVIPYVLSWVGGGGRHAGSIVLMAALVVPAFGIGSNVLRIQSKTLLDLGIVPRSQRNQILMTGINALLALAIAVNGGDIIELILYFYAAYLSAVWIPFIAYLLAHTGIYTFSQTSVRLSLSVSSLTALVALAVALFDPSAIAFNSAELTIMAVGMGCGGLSLLSSQVIEIILIKQVAV
jgi:SSS family solute:Na+ symporter